MELRCLRTITPGAKLLCGAKLYGKHKSRQANARGGKRIAAGVKALETEP